MRTPESRYPSLWYGVMLLAVLIVTTIVSFIDRQVLVLLVGQIKGTLHIGDFQMSLLMGLAFALFYSAFGIPIGRLADRTNRTALLGAAIFVWSVATLLCGFAGGFATLFSCRLLVGIGEAVLTPTAYSLVGDAFPPRHLTRAVSILAAGASVGYGLALLIAGMVIGYAEHAQIPLHALRILKPWQLAFVLVALPGFLVALIMLLVPEPARQTGPGKDSNRSAGAFRDLWKRRFDYLPLYSSAAASAVSFYGGSVWFPAHLARVFGSSARETGLYTGIIQLGAGSLGALLGVLLSEHFIRKGHYDGHLRAVSYTSLLGALCMGALFLPTLEGTLIAWFAATVFANAYFGVLGSAIQLITPNNMRGINSALYLLVITLCGLAGGSALVGALAQYAFDGMARGVGYSIAIVCAAAGVVAFLSARFGQRRIAALLRPLLQPQRAE